MTPTSGGGMVRGVQSQSLAWSVVTALAAALGGCTGGTETGNPSFEATLSYAAYSSAPESIAVRQAGSVATVTAAWLVLDDVRFVDEAGCASGTVPPVVVPGLGVGDHASGERTGTEFEAAEGRYCAVELPLALTASRPLPASAPAELTGSSVLIEGTLSAGTPFSVRSQATPSFHLGARGGAFDLSPERSASLMGFDVATWLGPIDWTRAALAGGRIEISPDTNTALLGAFEAALAKGVVLFRDDDADGRLDASPERLADSP